MDGIRNWCGVKRTTLWNSALHFHSMWVSGIKLGSHSLYSKHLCLACPRTSSSSFSWGTCLSKWLAAPFGLQCYVLCYQNLLASLVAKIFNLRTQEVRKEDKVSLEYIRPERYNPASQWSQWFRILGPASGPKIGLRPIPPWVIRVLGFQVCLPEGRGPAIMSLKPVSI